jgi:pimeloyl-ACP methyl ester carboxylesterase
MASSSATRVTEEIVRVNGVDLCVGTFGDLAAPPILLVGGAAASMDWWDDELCQRLADGGRFVIRYDNRDTGRSVSYPRGAPAYTGADLAADAIGILDVLGLARAHLVGISMGGALAQRIAMDQPDRVASLTLISTSPIGPRDPGKPDLPPSAQRLKAHFAEPAAEPDWSDRAAAIESIVDGERPYAGSLPLDEARLRRIAGRVYDRTTDLAASRTNHWILEDGEPLRGRLSELALSTLVLHGTEDPLFPYGHGLALEDEIPGARLVPLPRVGHQMPPPEVWDIVVPAILRHTGGWPCG